MKTKLILFVVLSISACRAQLVVPATVECATSTDGSVVGVQNPLNPPVTAVAFSGTLGSGNYFVEFSWYDAAAHVTLVSPEVEVQLVATGQIQVSPPSSGMPATAAGMNVFIGTTSGGETLQGSIADSGTYIQSVPLVTGSAVPSTNTTICAVVANDAGWPTGTGYQVTLTTPAGATMPGYPQQWQLLGPGNTVNLSQGIPFYNGTVQYPVPILSQPYGHGPQSISGPLSIGGFPFTAGSITASSFDNIFYAGSSAYPNINAAVTAAGSAGTIIVPNNYGGSDAITNPNNLPVIDLRSTGGVGVFGVWSIYGTAFPVTGYPEGNDFVQRVRGPADHYIEHLILDTTTTQSLTVGVNTAVPVAAVTVGNATRGTVQSGTTALLSLNAPIIVGRNTANEETVTESNFSVVDASHITFTAAKTHSGTTDIEQIGGSYLSSYNLVNNSCAVKPSQDSTNCSPLRVMDESLNLIMLWPGSTADTFPYNAVQFVTPITGAGNGSPPVNGDLILRDSTSAYAVKMETSASAITAKFSDNGFQLIPGIFAPLPACASGTEGAFAAVTDSTTNTWGATITGSGSDHVLAYCDGTNWTVAGK